MARLLTAGAESQAAIVEGVTTGTPSFSTSVFRSGAASFDVKTSNSITFAFTGAVGTTYYARSYFFKTGNNGTNNDIGMSFRDASGTFLCGLLTTSGASTLSLIYGAGLTVVATSAALSDSTWYMLELSVLIGVGAIDACEARIDGVSLGSASGLTISDAAPGRFQVGASSWTTAFHDDIALNDSTGAAQTSWPGSGKVVLLKPISDNARGTGWVNDANAASGFFDATDNTPPVGIADTTGSTGLHQIRNGTSNANSSVDLNLTTYTNAGIGATDTINVVVPVVATGAPVSTSAKQGTIGISSNPVIANVSLGAGGTSGAFWSGTAAGTFPTGWKASFGTPTYAPSVTLGNSPVARITQVTSSTRIAMVCFMGMYVDYTPSVARVPRSPGVDSGNAHF